MADMDVQIKYTSNAKDAAAEVKLVAQAFQDAANKANGTTESLNNTEESAQGTAAALGEASDSATETANALGEVADQANNVEKSTKGIKSLINELNSLEKSAKKLGRDFSALVTAPIAALAGLSLKNVFDKGALEGSSGSARNLALAFQNLKKNFDEVLNTVGTQLTPIFIKLTGVLNTLLQAYRSLSSDTRQFINGFALAAAAIGPLLLAFSSLLSISIKLAPVFAVLGKSLLTVFQIISSPAALVAGLVTSLVGITNVFLKLRQAGVGTADALLKSFTLFVTGFNNYITKNILKGVNLIAMAFDKISMGTTNISGGIDVIIKNMESQFSDAKGDVDNILETVGSSAASAFTFGFSEKISGIGDVLNDAFSNVNLSGLNEAERKAELESFRKAEDEYTRFLAGIKERSKGIAESLSGGLTDALADFAEGSKSASEAFGDFARQTVRSLVTIATQAAIMNALFPPGSPIGNLIGSFAAATSVRGYAEGGFISGPGTGTSDSIVARLSNGEFVNDAKTVRHFGKGFFENLKSVARGGVPVSPRGSLPGYADGGMVSSGGPQVVIENKGSPKQVTSQSFDANGAVLTVIIDDLGKNGPVSKAIQNTFSVKRGGFT